MFTFCLNNWHKLKRKVNKVKLVNPSKSLQTGYLEKCDRILSEIVIKGILGGSAISKLHACLFFNEVGELPQGLFACLIDGCAGWLAFLRKHILGISCLIDSSVESVYLLL